MSTLSILTSTFAEICTMIGFFILLGIIIVALRWCYDRIVAKTNANKRNKQIRLAKIQANKQTQRRINELMAYYELQSNDAVKNVQPNEKLLKVCNWD